MKTFFLLLFIFIILIVLSGCNTTLRRNKTPDIIEDVRTTSYTHNEPDHYQFGKLTCLGTTLRHGDKVSAASDWSFLPVGTEFKIGGCEKTYVIEDIGSALAGTKTVDIYTPCRYSMHQRGTQHVDITIIEWGCFIKSLEILEPRSHSRAARVMTKSLKTKI